MIDITKKIIAIALTVFVAGCMYRDPPQNAGPWKPGVNVSTNNADISFAPGSGRLSSKEIKKLKQLVSQASLDAPIYARVMTHKSRADSSRSLMRKRIGTIIRCLKKLGDVERQNVEVIYTASAQGDMKNQVTVSLDQYVAQAPNCPGWNEYMDSYGMPEGEAHFGCSTAVNLTHMIAEPRDIKKGRALQGGDGRHNAFVIQQYRIGKQKELKKEEIKEN